MISEFKKVKNKIEYEIKIILSKLTVFIKIFINFHQNCL